MEDYDPFSPTEDVCFEQQPEDLAQPDIKNLSGKAVNMMDSGFVDEDQNQEVQDEDGEDEGDSEESDDDDDDDEDTEDEEGVEEEEEGGASDQEDGDRCPVCLCIFKGQDIGTPESCDHNFCLDCIQEWSKNVNTCPVDRTVFRLIMAKHGLQGEIFMRVDKDATNEQAIEHAYLTEGHRVAVVCRCSTKQFPVEDRNALNDPEVESDEEDLTLCEICGRGDREDRLLLCDGCDLGFHLDCLTPPLKTVPVEEWFCNECSERNLAAHVPETRSVFRRQIARTLVSERVRAALQETRLRQTRSGRLLEQYSDDEEVVSEFVTAMDVEMSRSRTSETTTTTRTSRRRVTRKTKRKTKKGKTRKRRTKRSKRKTKASSDSVSSVVTPKTRIAKNLGLVKPRKGRSIPDVRQGKDKTPAALDANRPLSILGDKNELLAFDDGSDTENSAPASFSKKPISRYSALSRLSNKPIRQPLANRPDRRPVTVSEPVSTSTSSCDLLGAIMLGQDLLHKDANQVKIARDGSLHIRERTPSPPPRQPRSPPTDHVEKVEDNPDDRGMDTGAAEENRDDSMDEDESGIIDTMPVHRQLSALQQMAGYGSGASSPRMSDGAGDDPAGENPAGEGNDGESAGDGQDGDSSETPAGEGQAGESNEGCEGGASGDHPGDDGDDQGDEGNSAGGDGGDDGDENREDNEEEVEEENQDEEAEEETAEVVEEGEEAQEVEPAEEAMEEEQEVEEGAEEGQEAPELTEEMEGAVEEGTEVQGEEECQSSQDEGGKLTEEVSEDRQEVREEEAEESMEAVTEESGGMEAGEGEEAVEREGEEAVEREGEEAVEGEGEEAVERQGEEALEGEGEKVAEGEGEEAGEGEGEEGEVDDGDGTPGLEEDDASATPNLEEDQMDQSSAQPSTPPTQQDSRIVQERTPVKARPQAPSSDTMVLYSDELGDAEVDSETMEEYAPKMPVSELPRIPKLNKNRLQVEIRGAAMDEEEDRLKRERRRDYEDDDRRDDRDYKRRDRDRRHRYDEEEDRRGDNKRGKRSSSRDRNRSRRSRSREDRQDRQRRGDETRRRSRSRDRSRRGSRRRDREPSYERSPERRRRKREREETRSTGRRDKDEFGRDLSSRDRYSAKDSKYESKEYYDSRSKDDDRGRKRGKRDDDYYDSYSDNYRDDKYGKYDRDNDNASGHGAKYSRDDGSKYGRDREERKRSKDSYKDDQGEKAYWEGHKRDESMYSQPYQQPYGAEKTEPVQSIKTLSSVPQPDVDHQPIDMDLTYDPADPTEDTSPSPPMDALVINEDVARESVLVNVPVQQPPFVQEHPPNFRPNEPPPPLPMFPNLPPGMTVPGGAPHGMPTGPPGPPGPPPPPGGPDLLRHPVHLVSPQNLPNIPGLPQNLRQGLVLNHMLLNPLNRLPLMAGMQLPPGVQQLQNRMVVPPGMTLPPGARVPFEPGMEQVRLMTQMELGARPPTSLPIGMVAVSEGGKVPSPQVPPPEILRNIPPPRLPGGLPVNQSVLRQVRPGSPDGPPPPPPPPPKMATEDMVKKSDPTMDNIATLQRIKTLGSLLNTQVAMASLASLKPAVSDDTPDFKAPNPPKKVDFKVPPPPRLAKEDKPAEIVEPVAMDMSSPNMDDFSPPPMDMFEIELESTEKSEKKGKENKESSPKKKREKESPKTKKESSHKKDKESKRKEDKDDWSKLVGMGEEKKKKKKSSSSSGTGGGASGLSDDFMKKMNRQERVIEEVKLAVKPHYAAKKITKEEYKDILRKSVPKICHSKSGDINPAKIKAFIDVYVGKIRQRKKRQGEVHSSTSPSTIDSTALAKYAIPERIREKVKAKEMEKIKKAEAFTDKTSKKHKEKKKKH